MTPSLPIGNEGSLSSRSFPASLDPYALAVSDVCRDLFDEAPYSGKGIYEIDVFEAALDGQVPDNTILSHDLLEGIFARAGRSPPTSKSWRNFRERDRGARFG